MTRRPFGYAALQLALTFAGCADPDGAPLEHEEAGAASVDGSVDPSRPNTSDAGTNESGAGRSTDAGRGNPSTPEAGSGLDASSTPTRDAGLAQPTSDGMVKPNTDVWKPKPGTSWQWDLSGKITKLDVAADVFDIDGFENDAALVTQLHGMGKKVICYISVGTYEPDRADAKDFPKAALGKYWPEWGETYIDIRSEAVRSIMKKRLDMCRTKGFDGVEPDNMDMFEGGASDTGFPLTEADGIAYAKWLADEAHARGMSIGQKNASSITTDIEAFYDWALTEDCYADDWCNDLKSYPTHDKAVFMCEYTDRDIDFAAACSSGKALKFSPILKKRDLDSWIELCK